MCIKYMLHIMYIVLFRYTVGYSLCWDNVQKMATARHQTNNTTSKMHMWALAYAAKNRVTIDPLNVPSPPTTPAKEMPLHTFLPNDDDWSFLATEMASLVQAIVCKHFKFFENCMDTHPRPFVAESSRKSHIVSE
jgi:hypothetical protein